MNDLKVFSNSEFGELGIMLIDGKEYFPAIHCAKILGYANPRDAIQKHCKTEGVANCDVLTNGGKQSVKYINESNLYRLIVSSKLPAAEKFERWVFDEVLPSIRQTGGYGNINIEQVIAQTATAVVSEVMKQLVPALKDIVNGEPDRQDIIWESQISRKQRKPCGIIIKLAPEIRDVVDEMLISNCSYKDVKTYLKNNGIGISEAAICRYYNNFLR
ncbi:MAG: Bro-N domain-containing protein [Oscillospiraceae bacterium]